MDVRYDVPDDMVICVESARTRHWSPEGLRGVWAILRLFTDGGRTQWEIVTASEVADVLLDKGLPLSTYLSPPPKSDHELILAVRDLMGTRGLGLRRLGEEDFVLPRVLPKIEGDRISLPAIYGDGLSGNGSELR